MDVLETRIDTNSEAYQKNRSVMKQRVEALREALRIAMDNRSDKAKARLAEQNKLPVRQRLERLLDRHSPFLEIAPLAAKDMYDKKVHGAGIVAGIGRVAGRLALVPLQDGVRVQHFLDVLAQLDAVQLQQPDRLLKLRRQREFLRETELEGRFSHNVVWGAPGRPSRLPRPEHSGRAPLPGDVRRQGCRRPSATGRARAFPGKGRPIAVRHAPAPGRVTAVHSLKFLPR